MGADELPRLVDLAREGGAWRRLAGALAG